MLLCSYYPGVHRAEFDCSHFAPDIVQFACSKVKCPYFLFFSNNYDPSFTVLFLTLLI